MSKQTPLDSDEKIAILVAFSCIGAILFWGFSRPNQNWNQSLFPTAEKVEISKKETKDKELITPDSLDSPDKEEKIVVKTEKTTPDYTKTVTEEPTQYKNINPIPAPIPTPIPNQPTPPIQNKSDVHDDMEMVDKEKTETSVVEKEVKPENTDTTVTETETTQTKTTQTQETPKETPEIATNTIPNFIDVPETYWAYPFIRAFQEDKLLKMTDDQKFNPDGTITRAQYAQIVAKVFNKQEERGEIDFKDTSGSIQDKIEPAIKEKFLSGYPDETFQPNDPISRVHVLLSLVNGLQLTSTGDDAKILAIYEDQNEIPDYAKPAIKVATEKGLVVNPSKDKKLNPNGNATRAEVAAMIYQALVATEGKPAINSDYILKLEPQE